MPNGVKNNWDQKNCPNRQQCMVGKHNCGTKPGECKECTDHPNVSCSCYECEALSA